MNTDLIPANIKFVNKYHCPISIHWFDETKQEEVHYCLLSPDRHYVQPTFIRQQWVIRKASNDNKLISFVVEAANTTHEISKSGKYVRKESDENSLITENLSVNGYEKLEVAGFIVFYEPGVFEYEPRLRQHLYDDLAECRKIILLSDMAKRLMNTPRVYVNKDYKYDNKSADRACCSHWSADWLHLNGNIPEKEGSVEIYDAKRYVDWCKDQPAMFFHELCHSFHFYIRMSADPDMKEKDKLITKAYDKARETGNYESVMRIYGHMMKHYGLTNALEYFAECCEAFFSSSRFRNDYYPFIFEELKEFDKEGFDMVAAVWDVQDLVKDSGKVFDVTNPPDYDPVQKKYVHVKKKMNI